MAQRTTTPFNIPSGIVKTAGPLEARGRYIDADKIRFSAGKAQTIGGWVKLTSTVMNGKARGAIAWSDGANRTVVAIGTNTKLYTLDLNNLPVDCTPNLRQYRIFSAFTTTSASTTVVVKHVAHGRTTGDVVTISDVSQTVGGLALAGTYTLTVLTTDTYQITAGASASSTVSTAVGDATVSYRLQLTNPFNTTNASATVTVTYASHNLIVGQTITFSGASAVGGITLNGTYLVVTVPTSNTFTITHTSNATSTAGPGGGTVTVVVEYPPGEVDPTGGFGWGIGDYGEEEYGTPRSATNLFYQPHYWGLTTFGRLLLAAPLKGPLFYWDPLANPVPRASQVVGAPAQMKGLFTTPERFVVALGCSDSASSAYDPMLVRWCSQADFTDWTPSATNTANSRKLTVGKEIMAGGVIGEGLSMVWTDTAAYTMRYTGSRYVYETRIAGTGAGCAGPTAWAEASGRAFWYGSGQFWSYSAGIERIPNQDDILPWLNGIIRDEYLTKTVCFYNQLFNEMWWLFVTDTDTEPGRYVAYNISDGSWTVGTLTRSAAYTTTNAGNVQPYMVGTDGYVYAHEEGNDADTSAMTSYLETGPFQVEEGEGLVSVIGFIPDFSSQNGTVSVTLKGRDRAQQAAFDTDTVTVSPGDGIVDTKVRARHMSVRYDQSGQMGSSFGIGEPAVQIMSGGRKR